MLDSLYDLVTLRAARNSIARRIHRRYIRTRTYTIEAGYSRHWLLRLYLILRPSETPFKARVAHWRPFRYVAVIETTRCYGGPEEGGWWYDSWRPLHTERIPVWKTERRVQALTRDGITATEPGYTFAPAPADTDPMADYTEADLIGASWGPECDVRVSLDKPVRGDSYPEGGWS